MREDIFIAKVKNEDGSKDLWKFRNLGNRLTLLSFQSKKRVGKKLVVDKTWNLIGGGSTIERPRVPHGVAAQVATEYLSYLSKNLIIDCEPGHVFVLGYEVILGYTNENGKWINALPKD